jgi:hypothetical protein
MNINYMSIGHDCSPAATLRNLNIRSYAMPFDWVVSNLQIIKDCIEDNFNDYHKNLIFNSTKTRLIDTYGFQFPHDYPLNTNQIDILKIGEGVIGEEKNKTIIENWNNYHSIALEKYTRRIERLFNYLNSNDNLIILCRGYSSNDILIFKNYLFNKFNKQNIYFVVASSEQCKNKYIITCNPEINNNWNDSNIWLNAINKIKILNNLK